MWIRRVLSEITPAHCTEKKIELKKGEKICSLYQPDGKTEWWTMIADIRANDVRNIEIEKVSAQKTTPKKQ